MADLRGRDLKKTKYRRHRIASVAASAMLAAGWRSKGGVGDAWRALWRGGAPLRKADGATGVAASAMDVNIWTREISGGIATLGGGARGRARCAVSMAAAKTKAAYARLGRSHPVACASLRSALRITRRTAFRSFCAAFARRITARAITSRLPSARRRYGSALVVEAVRSAAARGRAPRRSASQSICSYLSDSKRAAAAKAHEKTGGGGRRSAKRLAS